MENEFTGVKVAGSVCTFEEKTYWYKGRQYNDELEGIHRIMEQSPLTKEVMAK